MRLLRTIAGATLALALQVLAAQRLEEATSPDVQRATLSAIADSQESSMDVERNTDLYDEILRELRRLREEAGTPEPVSAPGGTPQASAGEGATDAP